MTTERKKKKKKPGSTLPWLWLGIGGGVLLVVLIVAGVVLAVRPWERGGEKVKVVENNVPPPQPQGNHKIGGEVVREPKSLLGSIRARGDRAALDNELRQIVLFLNQYANDLPNPNARSLDGFLNFMKRDSPKIHDAIKAEKYYTVNVKARLGSSDIIAYETEIYSNGYYAARADNSMGFVSAPELKAGVGQP